MLEVFNDLVEYSGMLTLHRRFEDSIHEQSSRMGKALAAPKRVELLDLLAAVEEILRRNQGRDGSAP